VNKDLVKEVRIELVRREWTQSELARRIGISAAYLSLIMKGRRSVEGVERRILRELGLEEGGGEGPQLSGDPERSRRWRGRVQAT
jgi:transcriptional regulator with XRE-family HTH domain